MVGITTWTYRFLVGVWAEPCDIAGPAAVLPARVCDMDRDQECDVGSFAEIENVVNDRPDDAGIVPRRWERDA
jgi:hypothetical protein